MPTRQEKAPLTKLTVTDQVQVRLNNPEDPSRPAYVKAHITKVYSGAIVAVSPIWNISPPSDVNPSRGKKKKTEATPPSDSEVSHYSVADPDAPATWFALFETGETVTQTDNDPEILCVNHDKHNNFRK